MMRFRELPLLQEKSEEILLVLAERKGLMSVTEIAREAGVTYAHTWHIVEKMEKAGILRTERIGRQKAVEFTEVGEILANLLREISEAARFAETNRRIEEFTSKLQAKPEETSKVFEQLKNFKEELKSFAKVDFLRKFRLRSFRRLDKIERTLGARSGD